MASKSIIEALLDAAQEHGASDVFLAEGRETRMKVDGQLLVAGEDPLDRDELVDFWKRCGETAHTQKVSMAKDKTILG